MSTEAELIFEAIRKTIDTPRKSDQNSNFVAKNTFDILNRVARQLEPMIGVSGIEVLFNRALYLSSKEFAWLASKDDLLDKETLLATIKKQLESAEMQEALQASYTILVTFVKLLIALIGESLTSRLLEPVWTSASPTHPSLEAQS